jgi:hypothetical protein
VFRWPRFRLVPLLTAGLVGACGETPVAPDLPSGTHAVAVQFRPTATGANYQAVAALAGYPATSSSDAFHVVVYPTTAARTAFAGLSGVALVEDYGAEPDPAVSVFIQGAQPARSADSAFVATLTSRPVYILSDGLLVGVVPVSRLDRLTSRWPARDIEVDIGVMRPMAARRAVAP